MAKRGRRAAGISLDALLAELHALEARRESIVAQVRSAVSHLGGEAAATATRAKAVVVKAVKRTRRKMSTEARAKISAAQKAHWAKFKKGAKSKGAGRAPSNARDKARGG